jgi:diguanylate cyclase (GGDEF)-like protein
VEDFRLYRWFDACLQPASIITALLLPLVWGFIFYEIAEDQKRAEAEGARSAISFARLVEHHVYRTIKRVDDTLLELQDNRPADLTDLESLSAWLAFAQSRTGALQLTMIDAAGIMRASNRGTVPPVDLSDSDQFRHFSAGNHNDLFVSKLTPPRVFGRAAMRLGRRLTDKDGRFAGIVVASLEPDFLDELRDSFDTAKPPTIALLGLDGVVRAATGPGIALQNNAITGPDFGDHLLEAARKAPNGHFLTGSELGAEQRLLAFRRIEEYPFFATASMSRNDIMLQSRRNEMMYYSTGLLITIALCIATALASSRELRLKAAAQSLAQTNARFAACLANMPHGMCMFDHHKRLVVCNERYGAMYGLPPALTVPGTSLLAILEARVAVGACPVDGDGYIQSRLAEAERGEATQFLSELRDGRTISVDLQPMSDGGYVALHQDITQQKVSEARISFLARHDPLTGLLNRASLSEKIEEYLAHARRHHVRFALLLLDLDRFKQVNDGYGHPAGDALLQQVAARLSSELRQTDVLARLGGDEFAIILSPEVVPQAAAAALAARLIEIIGRSFSLDQCEVMIGVSIGIAVSSEETSSAGRLMKMADLALYETKAHGRNDFTFFEPRLEETARVRNALEQDLRRAVTEGAFVLHYQPILTARSGTIDGAEALIRWQHETQGWIPPDRFIPLAEETGLIGEIGLWVLRTACNEAAHWPSHTKVSVNISAVQLRDPMIVDYVICALAESGLPPERLELEITETALIDGAAECRQILRQFKALGVTIALDDFGTGYSSLSQLTMFPFDRIKIDKSFTMNMTSRADCAAVIAGVLALAASLEIATTAEGVETQEHYSLLKLAGVTSLQGYLIRRPGPAAALDFDTAFNPTEVARVA